MFKRTYLLLLSMRRSLAGRTLDLARVRGALMAGEAGSVMAFKDGVVMGFVSAEPPHVIREAVRAVVGSGPEILVIEAGRQWAGSGPRQMGRWLAAHLPPPSDSPQP